MRLPQALAALIITSAACVPADENLPLGSAQFTITGRGSPRLLDENLVDGRVAGTIAATNMFVRGDGGWKMLLHHGSPVAAS